MARIQTGSGVEVPRRAFVVSVLGVGVIAISCAAVLIRLADAPGLSVAVWRVVISLAILGAGMSVRARREALRALAPSDRRRLFGAGLFLGLHFWSWITSLSYTTVAASVLLVTTNPVWVGLLSPWVLGERPSRRAWIGIGIATAGAMGVALGTEQTGVASAPLLGNALALAGALAGSCYLMLGRAVRPKLDLWTYATATVAVAALVLVPAAFASGTPLGGFDATTWWALVGLALGPQLIGHNAISWSLRWVRADMVAVTILTEPVGAAVLAWVLLSETPDLATVVGGVVLLTGVGIATIQPRRRKGASF